MPQDEQLGHVLTNLLAGHLGKSVCLAAEGAVGLVTDADVDKGVCVVLNGTDSLRAPRGTIVCT
jgi:hypothetical protein